MNGTTRHSLITLIVVLLIAAAIGAAYYVSALRNGRLAPQTIGTDTSSAPPAGDIQALDALRSTSAAPITTQAEADQRMKELDSLRATSTPDSNESMEQRLKELDSLRSK